MTDILGLHHYAIRAVDWDATVKLYIEGLGFEMVYPWTFEPTIKRSAFLRAPGGGFIEVFGSDDDAAGAPENSVKTAPFDGKVEPGIVHVALKAASPESVDRVVARAVAAGATVHTKPQGRELVGEPNLPFRIAMIVGLDGEVIEICHNGQIDV
jgi:catechol 2,3-dioxygenase-like lactoylglutathione lyase family enzyme